MTFQRIGTVGDPKEAEAQAAEIDLKATVAKIQEDARRDRLHAGATGPLPANREEAAREMTEEQRALRASRPRNRRWKELDKLDRELDELSQRQAEAGARLGEAEAALSRAPEDDARSLARWIAEGEKGKRPAATVYERERERDAAHLLVNAVQLEVDETLERRRAYIEGNRARMLEDAEKDVEDAQARVLAVVRQLPALREALIAARETRLWVAAFPSQAEGFGFTSKVALGLQEPVSRILGTKAQVDYNVLLALLEEDVSALAAAHSRAQREKLGIAAPATPLERAMWDSDPDMVEWKKSELERVRSLAEWSPDPHSLAREPGDLRPDPQPGP